MKRSPLLAGTALLMAWAVYAWADDTVEPLHVTRPLLQAEQEKGQICLEFDREIDAKVTQKLSAGLKLEQDGKSRPINRHDVTAVDRQLCLSNLEHGKSYRLVLNDPHEAEGVKLFHSYSLSFSMPHRPMRLAFIDHSMGGDVARPDDTVRIASTNVARAGLELYRVSDPIKMIEAWNQRGQMSLAPSESLYFAEHNADLVAQQSVPLTAPADQSAANEVTFASFGAPAMKPGLYLLVAKGDTGTAADAIVNLAKGKTKNKLKLEAAQELLRSNLTLHALRDGATITLFTERTDSADIAAQVRLVAVDGNQKIVADIRSDAQGEARIGVDKGARTIIGIDDQGNAAFLELTDATLASVDIRDRMATLIVDPVLAAPYDPMALSLTLHTLHRQPVVLTDSYINLLRPDHGVDQTLPVKLGANGEAHLNFGASPLPGIWHAVWQQDNNPNLADSTFRITANPLTPELSLATDRSSAASGDDVSLQVHSRSNIVGVMPYVAGGIELVWRKSEHPYIAWRDFDFDDGRAVDDAPLHPVFFVTDRQGNARVHLKVQAPEHASAYLEAHLRATGDAANQALASSVTVISLRSPVLAVGIRPESRQGHFSENSTARFDIVALDGDGHAVPAADLTYQVFEQGRNFAWYQADGLWTYKPEQKKRGVGGGNLIFSDKGKAFVEWPVTSGTYRLEIYNADGAMLSTTNFTAGWGDQNAESQPQPLDLKPAPAVYTVGKDQSVGFTLAAPAVVTATVADDRLRTLIHTSFAVGSHEIHFTPAPDWADRIQVRIETQSHAGLSRGEVTMTAAALQSPTKPRAKTPTTFDYVPDAAHRLATVETISVAPQQGLIMPSGRKTSPGEVLFAAPFAIDGLPDFLSMLVLDHPMMTTDIADDLRLRHRWRDRLVTSGLESADNFRIRQGDLLDRLVMRQMADGGFASALQGESSDLKATVHAFRALTGLEDGLARNTASRALRWLQRDLGNTWFKDTERADRAEAYAALAEAGQVDSGSLHYFSDTSADKDMSVAASADVAFAFASLGDKAAAQFWLDRANSSRGDQLSGDMAAHLLAVAQFTANDADIPPVLTTLQKKMPTDMQAARDGLTIISALVDRHQDWKVGLGKDVLSPHGLAIVPSGEKSWPALRNLSPDQPFHLIVAVTQADKAKDTYVLHVHNLDGSDKNGALQRGASYVAVVEGPWRAGQHRLALHANAAPLLGAISCALQAPVPDAFLGWLSSSNLARLAGCEAGRYGLDAVLERRGDEPVWHAAFLVKSFGGDSHKLPEVSVRDIVVINPDDKDDRH